MSSRRYDGYRHVFFNESGNEVIIEPKQGQTLTINGNVTGSIADVGSNTQVIYNNNGTLSGSSNFSFENNKLFISDGVETGNIYGSTTTDASGYNEIYRGTAPFSCVTTQTANLDNLGNDVVFSREDYFALFACPKPNDGGVSLWEEDGVSNFVEYTANVLTYSGLTTGAGTKFCALNENGDLLVLTNGDEVDGQGTTWTRSGATWTRALSVLNNISACRISGTTMLSYTYTSNFRTHTWNGSSWTLQGTLMTNNLSASFSLDYPIAIDNTRLAFSYGSNTYLYTYSGSWALSQTIALGAISIDYYNNILTHLTTTTLRIYEFGSLTATFPITNCTYCCTNGTYVFVITSTGVIRIYHKVSGVWTVSVNTYTLTGGGKMSASGDYLAVGAPTIGTYGTGYIFKIETYTNGPFLVGNNIDLIDGSNRISITASNTEVMRISNTAITNLKQISSVVPKNYLYNPSFKVYQRNIIGRTTGATASSFLYTFDRWQLKAGVNQASVVGSQSGAISGTFASRCQRNSGQTGTGTMVFGQSLTIEMTAGLAGKFLTLSFYARKGANFSPTSNNITARIITGLGSTDRSNLQTGFVGADTVATTTVSLTDSFVRYSITTGAATAIDITQLAVEFSWTPTGTASTNDWFEVSCVQLEANPFASDYYDIDYGTEVNRCSAFFQLITSLSAIATSTTAASMTSTLMCHMRSNPVLSSLRQDGTPNTGLNISEGAFNYTQSSVNIVDFNSSRNGLAFNASNFTGLTTNRGYICYVAAGNYAGVACSCELT